MLTFAMSLMILLGIREEMKELYFFDETFYWVRSGRRATVIEAECELTQSVRPDELRAAVVSALRVHRNFRRARSSWGGGSSWRTPRRSR